MTEVSHLNNASWHICQDVSPGRRLIYWSGKQWYKKRRGEWNETKGYLTVCEGGIFRHQTEWFAEQLPRGNPRALSDRETAWVWNHRLGLVNTEPQSTREYSERGRCPAERLPHHYMLWFNWLCASSKRERGVCLARPSRDSSPECWS